MTPPSQDDVTQALARIVRRRLVRGESVALPGLGTFAIRHTRSTLEEQAGEEPVLQPPRDHVTFAPEK